MSRDFLYRFSQYILVEDTWLVDVVRVSITIMAWLTLALLAKLYFTHRTGRMNYKVAVGTMITYFSVGYAQIIAIANPASIKSITFLNFVVFIGAAFSLVGTLKVMRIGLFKKECDDDNQS